MPRTIEEDTALVAALDALANLNRLQVMRALRTPRALSEIVVRDEGRGPPLARQSVRRHVDALTEHDIVRVREGERPYGETTEFVLNHQRLFALAEDLRRLAGLRPSLEPEGRTEAGPMPDGGAPRGPSLVLVHGLEIGATFDLSPASGQREWVIGRRRDAAVPLDFDSAASGENALIRWEGGQHAVEDLPGSRNGTRWNFNPLQPGERRPLARGDLIGVGRCLLLYWR